MSRSNTTANRMRGDANPLSANERAALIRMAGAGALYREMSAATGRSLGTVKTALSRLRAEGLVARRYSVAAFGALDD